MEITVLQTDIKWADPIANRMAVESALLERKGSDVYVMPEMFTTGFATKPEGIAESDGATLEWMKRMATLMNAAVAGSVAVRVGEGDYRNRFYFVTPDDVWYYDKRHLFTYGGEDKTYNKGEERVVVEWRGVRFLLQVCYDLRFPCFSRNKIESDTACPSYDVALYVANWPDSRRKVWDNLLRARAIENQAFVVGVNRVGDDLQCHYDGGSAVIDAYGRDVAAANEGEVSFFTASLDMERLRSFRKKFPVLMDAD